MSARRTFTRPRWRPVTLLADPGLRECQVQSAMLVAIGEFAARRIPVTTYRRLARRLGDLPCA